MFIEEEGRGEMEGTKEGHFILDKLVASSVYKMFKSILAKTTPNVKLQDPIEGIAMIKKPNAKFNRKTEIGRLFIPEYKNCQWMIETVSCDNIREWKWMVEHASCEEAEQMVDQTVGAYSILNENNGIPEKVIDVLTDISNDAQKPIVITAVCSVSNGRIAVGDKFGQVRLWDATAGMPGVEASSLIRLEPIQMLQEDSDIDDDVEGEEEDEFQLIIVSLCEVVQTNEVDALKSVLVALTEGNVLTMWSLAEENNSKCGQIIAQIPGEQWNGCLYSVGKETGLFLMGLNQVEDEDDEDEEKEEEGENNEEGEYIGCMAIWCIGTPEINSDGEGPR